MHIADPISYFKNPFLIELTRLTDSFYRESIGSLGTFQHEEHGGIEISRELIAPI